MKKKYGVGIRLIETLATLPIVLLVCVISVPSILRIGFRHLKYKIKLRLNLLKKQWKQRKIPLCESSHY